MAAVQDCYKSVEVKLDAYLSPDRLGAVEDGVMSFLDEYLSKYNDDIGGVVLSYSDIKLLHRKGRIIADQPFVHFRISCVFLAFAPQVSSTLVGTAHTIGNDHVGLLVDDTFNVSIPRELIHSDFSYDAVQSAWRDSTDDTRLSISVGTRVAFEVFRLETKSDILAITGRMLQDKAACILDQEDSKETVGGGSKSKKSVKANGEGGGKKRHAAVVNGYDEDDKGARYSKKAKKDSAEKDKKESTKDKKSSKKESKKDKKSSKKESKKHKTAEDAEDREAKKSKKSKKDKESMKKSK